MLIKSYFIITQVVVLFLFLLFSLMRKNDKYFIFSSRLNYSILLIGAIIIGYFFNLDYQLLCIPVKWVKISLVFYSVYLIGNILFKKIINHWINQFILGLGIFISLYLILFGSWPYLIWLILNLIIIVPIYLLSRFLNKKFNTSFFDFLNLYGVSLLLPYLILGWIYWQARKETNKNRIALTLSPLLFFVFGIILVVRMNTIINEINNSDNKVKTTQRIIENEADEYLTDLILGAHWKYHTKICLYDGKRPPYHDPVLGFAQPFLYLGEQFHHEMLLKDRIELYKKTFPKNKTKFDCKCGRRELIVFWF